MALGPAGAGAAQGDALEEVHVVADDRRLAHHDAHAVVDEELLADQRAGVDLDASEEAPDVREHPRGDFGATQVQRVSEAVDLAGVEARIGEYDLEVADGGRVAFAGRLDIAFNLP